MIYRLIRNVFLYFKTGQTADERREMEARYRNLVRMIDRMIDRMEKERNVRRLTKENQK